MQFPVRDSAPRAAMSGLTRQAFEDRWLRLDAEAQENKFSHQALLRLIDLYASLGSKERAVVDEVLSHWVLAGNPRQRFDALALIDEFAIRAALPEVRAALEQVDRAKGPSVPTDRAKLERIVARLDGPRSSG